MKIGDIVVARQDNTLMGKVIAIDDWDRATVKLFYSEVEVMIHICDLRVVEEAKCDD
jgi:hypothetical protein